MKFIYLSVCPRFCIFPPKKLLIFSHSLSSEERGEETKPLPTTLQRFSTFGPLKRWWCRDLDPKPTNLNVFKLLTKKSFSKTTRKCTLTGGYGVKNFDNIFLISCFKGIRNEVVLRKFLSKNFKLAPRHRSV